MMNSTSTMSSFGSAGFGFVTHHLFGLALLFGLILLLAWAIKNLKKGQLLNWSIGLIIIGGIGWAVTMSSAMSVMHGDYKAGGFGFGSAMMNQNIDECMQNEGCHKEMETFMHDIMGVQDDKK